jgi:hypothetical protein
MASEKLADKHYKDKREILESVKGYYEVTDYPKPFNVYRIIYDSFSASIEESYFWVLNHLRTDLGFPHVVKIQDIMASSEQSSFWGQAQQRMSIQQDRVSQYLGVIGKMTKELFQIVREIRIIKERLSMYNQSVEGEKKGIGADISLKGYWVDLVEGGAKSPASVYGMAQQVGFTILPDLFFRTYCKNKDAVEEKVGDVGIWAKKNGLAFNQKIKEVLLRKLKTFYTWRDFTWDELKTRDKFMLRHLRQHYNAIKMYINWIKPAIKNAQRLHMRGKQYDSPDLALGFETAAMELEFLAAKQMGTFQNEKGEKEAVYACVLATFDYTARPEMSYHQDGYQHKGPMHVGRIDMIFRSYAWSLQEIEKYRKYREEEDLALLGSIDDTLKVAVDAMGEEIWKYLKEAEAEAELPEEAHKKNEETEEGVTRAEAMKMGLKQLADPFTSVFSGFGQIVGVDGVTIKKGQKNKLDELAKKDVYKKAEGLATKMQFTAFKNYKKAHGMVMW